MKRAFCIFALCCVTWFMWAVPSLAAPSGTTLCYALANNATAPHNTPYTAAPNTSYNPAASGIVSINHVDLGVYSVTCFGVNADGREMAGTVQVTAVGDTNVYCHVGGWRNALVNVPFEAGRLGGADRAGTIVFPFRFFSATVLCFGRGGGGGGGPAPADSEFTLLYVY